MPMAKAKTAYLCTECGAHSVKWAGQCPDCASWNTLTATTISTQKGVTGPAIAATTLDAA
jgi:DNA repair protein RadA/Sms